MIGSRCLNFVKFSNQITKNYLRQNGRQNFQKQITRGSHDEIEGYYYRHVPKPNPKADRYAEILGGIAWWWLVWHFITDIHELTAPSPYPDPASLTDEELGIPPDDED